MTKLTLAAVAANRMSVTYTANTRSGEQVWLRPLLPEDAPAIAAFLSGLSPQTQYFSTFPSYDATTARELCHAINRYDKLRFVVESAVPKQIIGLFEFSFDIPVGDLQRYAEYGLALDAEQDCRFGPTLADAYQDQGLGSRLFPYIVDVARRFGKKRVMLWGGVLADNPRAIRYYTKQGFVEVGTFVARDADQASDGYVVIDMILDLAAYHAG